MTGRRMRRLLSAGATTIGVVLAVASVAYACTVYRGTITGDGNGANDIATPVVGRPSGAGAFQWCPDPPPFTASHEVKEGFWKTKVDFWAPSLTVSVSPATECLDTDGTNKLPQPEAGKFYKVGLSKGYWDESDQGFATGDEDNCHSLEANDGQANYGKIIDYDFAVDANGNGSETFDLSDSLFVENLHDGWNTVCVYLPLGGQPEKQDRYFNPANALNFFAL